MEFMYPLRIQVLLLQQYSLTLMYMFFSFNGTANTKAFGPFYYVTAQAPRE